MRWMGLALVLAGCSCGSGSSLEVRLVTDLIAGGDYAAAETELTREGQVIATQRTPLGGGAVLDGEAIADLLELASGEYRVEVRLLDARGGVVVAQRAAVEVSGRSITTLVIARACLEHGCGDDETCVAGECIPASCALDPDEDECAPSSPCSADDGCGAITTACITPRCREGTCLQVPEHGRCTGALVCSSEGECIEDMYADVIGPEGDGGEGARVDATFIDCPVERIDLQGRFEIAAAIALSRFHPEDVEEVVLARGDNPAGSGLQSTDALIAGPLARLRDAPLLLFAPPILTASTTEALEELAPSRVTIVGATDPAVEDRLRAMGYTITHLGGADRDQTAARVAQQIVSESGVPEAVIASGEDASLRDALIGAAAAADVEAPLLFVTSAAVPAPTAQALTDLAITQVSLIGGSASVPASVEEALRAITNVRRYGGDDPSATAAVVARELFIAPVAEVFVVRGLAPGEPSEAETYAMGLTALALPILLTTPSPPELGAATRAYLASGASGSVTLVGNRIAISEAIEREVCVALAE